MGTAKYSIMLSARPDEETAQAARLLDQARLVYDRVNVSDYWEPRLRYRIGDMKQSSEVIGLLEIKEVIPYIVKEVEKQQAA